MPVLNVEKLIAERVAALQKAHEDAHTPRAELDLSGGVDSAVMACLLVLALGPENVTLAHTRMSTAGAQTLRATNLSRALKCRVADGSFTGAFNVIMEELGRSLEAAGYNREEIDARCEKDPTILGSIRSCLRAPLGRAYNRLTGGGLRHGTGNEDEDRVVRFYQKGGDGEVDSNPIAFLSKGETYQLALGLGNLMGPEVKAALLPIIEATPSPDLWGTGDDHSDEAELKAWLKVPFTYSRINTETGEYKYVGTIERMNRTLDLSIPVHPNFTIEGGTSGYSVKFETVLFNKVLNTSDPAMDAMVRAARTYFPNNKFSYHEVRAFLLAARKAEAQTRHKMNPNCSTYGSRRELVLGGILTNDLPEV